MSSSKYKTVITSVHLHEAVSYPTAAVSKDFCFSVLCLSSEFNLFCIVMTPKCSLRHYKRQFPCSRKQKSRCVWLPSVSVTVHNPKWALVDLLAWVQADDEEGITSRMPTFEGWRVNGVTCHVSEWLFLSFMHQWGLRITCETEKPRRSFQSLKFPAAQIWWDDLYNLVERRQMKENNLQCWNLLIKNDQFGIYITSRQNR